jgi:hypothetical protein
MASVFRQFIACQPAQYAELIIGRAFARPVGYCALKTWRQQFILQCFRPQSYSHEM